MIKLLLGFLYSYPIAAVAAVINNETQYKVIPLI